MKYFKSILVVFVLLASFGFASLASAMNDPFSITFPNGCVGTAKVSGNWGLNPTAYAPGSVISVWGEMIGSGGCEDENGVNSTQAKMTAQTSGSSLVTMIPMNNIYLKNSWNPHHLYGYGELTAPTTPGTYAVNFFSQAFNNSKTHNTTFVVLPSNTVTVTANPVAISAGGTSTISWISTGTTYCDSGGHGTGISGSYTVSPSTTGTHTYSVTCYKVGFPSVTDTATVTVRPAMTITTSTNPAGSIAPGAKSKIIWSSTNADSCTLSDPSGAVVATGLSNVTGFEVGPLFATANNYIVNCKQDASTTASSCTGTYVSDDSSCQGTVVGSTCGIPDSPATSCEGYTQSACPGSANPWCHHGCHWNTANTNVSCETLNQTQCSAHSTCAWNTGSVIPEITLSKTVPVTVSNPSVSIFFTTNNSDSIDISVGSSTQLEWTTTGFSDNTSCDIYNDDNSIAETLNGTTLTNQTKHGVFDSENQQENNVLTIKCHENSSPEMLYSDSAFISVTGKPDLTATEVTTNPINVKIGENTTLTSVIKNIGTKETGDVGTHFSNYLRITTDDPINPISYNNQKSHFWSSLFPKKVKAAGINVILTAQMDEVASGGSREMTQTYNFNTAAAYWVQACADKSSPSNTGTVDESSETNNCGPWKVINVAMPDLTINTYATPTTAVPHVAVNLSSTVKNIGTKETGEVGTSFYNFFQVTSDDPANTSAYNTEKNKFFSSLFTKKAKASGTIINLPAVSMGRLLAGGSNVTQHTYTFPIAGMYWVRACADKSSPSSMGTVTESNENNNCGPWTTVTVTPAGSYPDLTITTNITTNPIEVNSGENTTLSSVVKNIGPKETGPNGTKFDNFFQITTTKPVIGGGPSISSNQNKFFDLLFTKKANAAGGLTQMASVLGTQINALGAGESGTTTAVYKFTTNDVYYVRACADKNSVSSLGVVTESNEGNNCGPWTTVVVDSNALPDLTAGSITPATAIVGKSTSFASSVTNIGTFTTGVGFKVLLQVNANKGIVDVGAVPTTVLTAGTSRKIGGNYTFTETGIFSARICADKTNQSTVTGDVVESNEENNCGPWTTITVGDSTQGLCDDVTAKNYGLPAPCVYDPGLCLDPMASNYTQKLPCDYTGLCNEALAINYGKPLPCIWDKNICADENAANYGGEGACVYNGVCSSPEIHYNCESGTSTNNIKGSAKYTWKCEGINGGSSDSCSQVILPTCTDGIQNQGETGVDCGGPNCQSCGTKPTCTDGYQNGDEDGVDCGGTCPDACGEPTCFDKIKNGGETGVDCGEVCGNVCKKKPWWIER